MSGEPEHPGFDLVRRLGEAFNARDAEAFAAVAHPDIEFVPLLTPGDAPYRGREGMRRYMGDAFAWSDGRVRVAGDPMCVGDLVVARATLEIGMPGAVHDVEVVYVGRIRDGLVVQLLTFPVAGGVPDAIGVTPREPAATLLLELPAVATSVPMARHAVRGYAASVSCTDIDGVELATSEAVTNAVRHAYIDAGEPGDLVVTGRRDGADLLVSVADEGRGLLPRPDSPGLGMGISMMSRVARAVTFVGPPERERGTEVVMRFTCERSTA